MWPSLLHIEPENFMNLKVWVAYGHQQKILMVQHYASGGNIMLIHPQTIYCTNHVAAIVVDMLVLADQKFSTLAFSPLVSAGL